MGTPDFAVNSLKSLCDKHDVIGVFTKVDKPNLRGGKIKFVPVKEFEKKKEINNEDDTSLNADSTYKSQEKEDYLK